MKTLEWRFVNKSNWGGGPWQDEPDKKQWLDKATGLPCLIVRGPAGALCGYVGVPKGHPWFGRHYSEIEPPPEVHGSLTFSNFCSTDGEHGVCHVVENETGIVWWLGFDCNHLYDHAPALKAFELDYPTSDEIYRDLSYVESECRKLARQANKAKVAK